MKCSTSKVKKPEVEFEVEQTQFDVVRTKFEEDVSFPCVNVQEGGLNDPNGSIEKKEKNKAVRTKLRDFLFFVFSHSLFLFSLTYSLFFSCSPYT